MKYNFWKFSFLLFLVPQASALSYYSPSRFIKDPELPENIFKETLSATEILTKWLVGGIVAAAIIMGSNYCGSKIEKENMLLASICAAACLAVYEKYIHAQYRRILIHRAKQILFIMVFLAIVLSLQPNIVMKESTLYPFFYVSSIISFLWLFISSTSPASMMPPRPRQSKKKRVKT